MADNPFLKYVPQQGVSVTPLPESPSQRADRARDEAAAGRDETRTGIAVTSEARAGRQEEKGLAEMAFDQGAKLRNEFQALPQVKEYQTVIRQYATALNTNETPTGDQALITAYAKMLDPGSVVREQEFNTVASGDSAIGKVVARLNKEFGADSAGLLRPEVRARVRDEMQNLATGYNSSYNQARDQYSSLAGNFGLRPDVVVGQHIGAPYLDQIREFREARNQEPSLTNVPEGAPEGEVLLGYRQNDDGTQAPVFGAPGTRLPEGYQASLVGQGMSGVNEGLASFLGFPVDAFTGGVNAVNRGTNWLNEAVGGDPRANLPMIENPVGGGEWFRENVLAPTIYASTDDPAAQFTRRVGQSIGANALPVMGAANTGRQAIAGLSASGGGGVGAATAQQVAPGNVGAEVAAELIGSLGTGGTLAMVGQRGRQAALERAIPTVDELKGQTSDLYTRARASGATAGPAETQQMADTIEGILQQSGRISPTGRISEVSPQVAEAARQAREYAGQPMAPEQMETMRGVLSEGLMSPNKGDARIARLLMNEFDDWAEPLVPGLAPARETASRYLTAETLEQARELAGARAGQFSGSGFENALRTDYRALDRNAIKGRERFSDDVLAAVEDVSRGTPYSNTMRNIGRFAPTDKMGGLTALAPTTLATLIGGPEIGLAVGGGIAGTTGLARYLATQAGIRNAEIAELLARNGGPLPQAQFVSPDEERVLAALIAGQTAENGF